jgi:hypothetical protein
MKMPLEKGPVPFFIPFFIPFHSGFICVLFCFLSELSGLCGSNALIEFRRCGDLQQCVGQEG